jgi:hypothetical protein
LQRQKRFADGTTTYNGVLDCAIKTFRREGLLRFFAGLPMFMLRVGQHGVFVLLFLDILKY